MVRGGMLTDLGLEGRRVLVVGAAQGIGRATAIWLAELGMEVIAADVQDCSETVAASKGSVARRLDLSDPREIEGLIGELDTDAAPLYAVVNCAGLLLRRPLDETTAEAITRQTEVNQYGSFFLARAALARMQARGHGRIVLYTSQGAFTGGFHGSIPYAMNKAAVTALVKSMARTAAPHGVTVNAVAPGGIDTAMMRVGLSAADLEAFRAMIPMGRLGLPEELAGPTAFLLSKWSAYVTGTTIHVNGGQMML